jgi:hypothetical protein
VEVCLYPKARAAVWPPQPASEDDRSVTRNQSAAPGAATSIIASIAGLIVTRPLAPEMPETLPIPQGSPEHDRACYRAPDRELGSNWGAVAVRQNSAAIGFAAGLAVLTVVNGIEPFGERPALWVDNLLQVTTGLTAAVCCLVVTLAG